MTRGTITLLLVGGAIAAGVVLWRRQRAAAGPEETPFDEADHQLWLQMWREDLAGDLQ